MRIVGIVGNVRHARLNAETVPHADVLRLHVGDNMLAENMAGMLRSLRMAIRTDVEPAAMASMVRRQIECSDPAPPAVAVRSMEDIVRTSSATQRFNEMLLGRDGRAGDHRLFMAEVAVARVGLTGLAAMRVSVRSRALPRNPGLQDGLRRGNST